jgi:hypothetical protein
VEGRPIVCESVGVGCETPPLQATKIAAAADAPTAYFADLKIFK